MIRSTEREREGERENTRTGAEKIRTREGGE